MIDCFYQFQKCHSLHSVLYPYCPSVVLFQICSYFVKFNNQIWKTGIQYTGFTLTVLEVTPWYILKHKCETTGRREGFGVSMSIPLPIEASVVWDAIGSTVQAWSYSLGKLKSTGAGRAATWQIRPPCTRWCMVLMELLYTMATKCHLLQQT